MGLMALLAMQAATAQAADGHTVAHNTTATINEWGVCRRVTNNVVQGVSMFVPTKFSNEWINSPSAFLSSSVPGVSLAACLDAMSLRFRSGNNNYLNRTPASNGNLRTWTWSGWVKRGRLSQGVDQHLISARSGSNPLFLFRFGTDDTLNVFARNAGGTTVINYSTPQVYRDPAAWYHVVLMMNATNATMTVFVNGAATTTSVSNIDYALNSTLVHEIGRHAWSAAEPFDGYMADVHFVDGQALAASAFGENDPATGQWIPKAYGGAYGTNGFRLDFGNLASPGADTSGNNNNWTPNNFSTTSGISYDPMRDVSYPAGQGNGFGNYATLNPLNGLNGPTFQDGNLTVTFPTGTNARAMSTQIVDVTDPSGHYWEYTLGTNAAIHGNGGFLTEAASALQNSYYSDGSYAYSSDGNLYGNGGLSFRGMSTLAVNDVVGFGVRSGNVYIYKNGVVQNSGNPVLTGMTGRIFPALWRASSTGTPTLYFNAGQRPFHSGLPAGFKALNTYSLPAPAVVTPTAYFKPITYTGNGNYLSVGAPVTRSGGATIATSGRFRTEASGYMARTFASAGNRHTWTWSGWVKRVPGGTQSIFSAGVGAGGDFVYFNSDHTLRIYFSGSNYKVTRRLFTDSADWMHVVVSVDTTLATADDRYRIFVDGVRITDFTTNTNPSLNQLGHVNNAGVHELGRYHYNACCTMNGYMSDVHFIDGQGLDASAFGQFNSHGVWVPKVYAGGFGTNGFRLAFGNSAAMGADTSGNGNNWTVNNIAASDQVTDTPSENFLTMNPLDKSSAMNLSSGNLQVVGSAGDTLVRATSGVSSGKWYFETTAVVLGTRGKIGIAGSDVPLSSLTSCGAAEYTFLFWTGNKCGAGGGNIAYGSVIGTGDVVQTAVDLDEGKIWFGVNGSWFASGNPAVGTNAAFSGISGRFSPYFFENAGSSFTQAAFNFGQRPFVHSPPAGFRAMSTAHISSTAFVPDLAIIKRRDAAGGWGWYDRLRGATLELDSSSTGVQSVQANGLLSFQAGGFTLGSLAKLNTSGGSFVAYLLKRGVTPGFDILSFAMGNGEGNTTRPHGLGVAPAMVIIKNLQISDHFYVYHKELANPVRSYVPLSGTGAATDSGTDVWPGMNNTNLGLRSSSFTTAANQNLVAYLFAEVPGFSKFGRYTGNGSMDGPFVHTGFRPAFLMVKRVDSTENWIIKDGLRLGHNPRNDSLYPNLTSGEFNDSQVDLLANGFKWRNINAGGNVSGGTYIYAAFAEAPFKYANAR